MILKFSGVEADQLAALAKLADERVVLLRTKPGYFGDAECIAESPLCIEKTVVGRVSDGSKSRTVFGVTLIIKESLMGDKWGRIPVLRGYINKIWAILGLYPEQLTDDQGCTFELAAGHKTGAGESEVDEPEGDD